MNLPLRRGAASVACASPLIVVAAIAMAAPEQLASTLGAANGPSAEWVNGERNQERRFKMELAGTFNRIDRKRAVIDDLNKGNVAFRDVVQEFMRLNNELPGAMVCLRGTYPGANDEEVTARNILAFAVANLRGSLAEKLASSARLLEGYRGYMQSLSPGQGSGARTP